jgi:hypothetical protein
MKHKFHAVQCKSDEFNFSSKAERSYYHKLKILQKSGEVVFFLMQVPFHLPGKTKYIVDFQVFYADGTVDFVDVKGVETEVFKIKKRQVEEIYPIKITIVK